ncbi:MAG: (d)CMP kinase [Clostridiaceae bacterium]|nr:(d)CMP kinase [Clostridiaceae bacterium]
MKNLQIAIDGPAGAGKSTIAKRLAESLQITYIDTGAMYRALTLKALKEKIDVEDTEKIIKLAQKTNIVFSKNIVYIDNSSVEEEIRSYEVTENVSYIAKIPEVRRILMKLQKKMAENDNVVMDGRDIGTHVLPNASIKIFLTASVEERAQRRYYQLLEKGHKINLKEIENSIEERDKIDSERKYAPLVQAEDAIILDTTGLTIDEVVKKIINLINKVNIVE